MAEWTFADNTSVTRNRDWKRSKSVYPRHLSISKGTFTQPRHIQVFKDLHGHEGVHAGNVGLRGVEIVAAFGLGDARSRLWSCSRQKGRRFQTSNFFNSHAMRFIYISRHLHQCNTLVGNNPYENTMQNVLDYIPKSSWNLLAPLA